MSRVRVKAYRSGLFAETLTAFLLRLRPHCIVAQRYKTPVGEIDLVALRARLYRGQAAERKRMPPGLPARQRRHICEPRNIGGLAMDFAGHDTAFDVVLAAPFARPRYIANVFPL